VLRDCAQVLTANPKSEKAYYRSAAALFALDRFEEAIDCCDRCLSFSPENEGVKALRQKALSAKDARLVKIKQAEAKERQAKMDRIKLASALKVEWSRMYGRRATDFIQERNIVKLSDVPDGTPYSTHFAESGSLVFPVWFLYPQHGVSDMIQEFSEDTAFGDHLDAMFSPDGPPPPFDPSQSQYTNSNLVVYATTHRKRALKCGKRTTLRELLASAKAKEGEKPDGIEMKDGCLNFVVVPKGDEEKKWIDEFKRNRGW
jgi:tetratricopeptide (TPR) repeat protein